MLDGNERLALHVSRNEEIKYLGEDDREGMVMTVREYLTLKSKGGDGSEVEAWLTKLGSQTSSIVGQVMNHAETRKYLLCLHHFEHFGYKTAFGARWMKKHLHEVCGGVSNNNVIKRMRINQA
jgi:hypothetical protein